MIVLYLFYLKNSEFSTIVPLHIYKKSSIRGIGMSVRMTLGQLR